MKRALVTGAAGFIGGHLTRFLKARDYWVRGVDIKFPEFAPSAADEFLIRDLRFPLPAADIAQGGFDEVYALAADMGGMGYISLHDADILRHNALINLNTLEAARHARVGRYLFASSACVYPEHLQLDTTARGLAERDAYPAAPDTEYGWEKLYAERLCGAYRRDYGLETRIVRFHNVFGPEGTWRGGREKAPAALCRKVAEAKIAAERAGWRWEPRADGSIAAVHDTPNLPYPFIEVWGDGEATRSFLYIDDCLEGLYRLMQSHYREPLNIGSDHAVSINELAGIILRIAVVDMEIHHIEGPTGVRGRNSDNALSQAVLDWEPQRSLDGGLELTYRWIEGQVREAMGELVRA